MVQDVLSILRAILESEFPYWFIAFACGCVAATAELFSRYSDGPVTIFKFRESYLYLALNGIVSLVAYVIIKNTGMTHEALGKTSVGQAVLAGFASMAILRSSFASIKRGQSTVQVGLAPVMQIFLDTVDRAFDRKRSQMELAKISEIMKDVDFVKAEKDLPTTCLNLMQNVSEEEQNRLGKVVLDLSKNKFHPQTKAVNLGVLISKVTGPEFLESAVASLGDSIRVSEKSTDSSSEQQTQIKELKEKLLKKSEVTP